jgi:hypothetical protein
MARFTASRVYRARYLNSNKPTGIIMCIRDENVISFDFMSTPQAMAYRFTLPIEECIAIEDDCERLVFTSPSGKTVICYADNRLNDDNYLKIHEIQEA